MKVLFVLPVVDGTGEMVTALHVAESLMTRGHQVAVLGTDLARRVFGERDDVRIAGLGPDPSANRDAWRDTLKRERPDVIVFADYPLMFFGAGTVPLAASRGWVASLRRAAAHLVTFDHFGFCRPGGVFMGPPHLAVSYQALPAIPPNMHVLHPCPMHGPRGATTAQGTPFRYWDVPIPWSARASRSVRAEFLPPDRDLLIAHVVSAWAWHGADRLRVPLYRYLPRLWETYLGPLAERAVVVSVNNGGLLNAPPGGALRVVNLSTLPAAAFESLLFSADLVVTENRISISIGKAVCALRPSAVFKNSHRLIDLVDAVDGPVREILFAMESERLGSVYPFEVFPSGTPEQIANLGLYAGNALSRAFAELEVFGGESTGASLRRLLVDGPTRAALRARQRRYVKQIQALPDGADVLERLARERRRPA